MGRSGRSAKRKSEGQKAATQKTATKKPPKSKPSKLKEKASNRYNVRALESHYGSIQKEYEHWGKKKREKVNGYGGKSGKQKPKKRQRTTIESTKKAPKKHNKMFQPNIILNMPKREAEGGIPWLKTPASAPPLTKRMKILNSISVDSHSMWLLDQELMNFSNYVQLAPQETQVRDHVIHAIQKGAMERFGITESDIQIFGSYAALQVCTFESDIDLAIWGLVGTNQSDPDPSGQAHAAKKDNTPYPQPKEPQPDHHNKKKQDRVLKWKAAIDEFERQKKLKEAEQTKDQNNDETQDSRAQSHQLTDADKNDAMRETIEAVSPLFVIDRAGADGKTSQSADADQKPAARTISKDDSQERKIPAWDDNAIDLIASFESSTHSDDDTADKLEGMKSRVDLQKATKNDEENQLQMLALPDAEGLAESTIAASANMDDIESAYADDDLYGVAEEGNEEEEEEMITTPRKRPRSRSLVSLSSATTCSDNHSLDETGLEVSFFNEPKRRFSASSHATKIGDDTRGLINSKLNQLTKTIRRTGVVTSIHVRKSARVPIINMETRYGFECDIALGGHNGNDTSAYAATQIARHPSFAPVVMLLKILLNQHELDKPFTGGLGSFKLYVLVANHIELHLSLGGSDSPAEILLMFFYRYGRVTSFHGISGSAETDLMRVGRVQCRDGGLVELNHVFKKDQCVEVFKVCWQRLKTVLEKETTTQSSLIRWIVHAKRLTERRTASVRILSPGGVLPPPVFGLRTRSPPVVGLRTRSLPVVGSQPWGLPVFPPRTWSQPIVASRTRSQCDAPPLSPPRKKRKRSPAPPAPPPPPAVASRTRSSGSPSPPRRKKAKKPKKSSGEKFEEYRTNHSVPTRRSRKIRTPKEEEYSTNHLMTTRTRSHPSEPSETVTPSETDTVATRTRSHSFDEADHFSTIQKSAHKNRNHPTGDGKKLSRKSRRMARKEKRKQKKKHRYSS